MIRPIAVEVREGAGYIRYRTDDPMATLDLTESCSVAVDVNAAKEIVGIEILDVAAPEQVEIARRYATDHDLAFPRDLAGVLVPA